MSIFLLFSIIGDNFVSYIHFTQVLFTSFFKPFLSKKQQERVFEIETRNRKKLEKNCAPDLEQTINRPQLVNSTENRELAAREGK